MPTRPLKDAIVIVLDVGKSVSTLHDYEEQSFFKQAKDCVSWIIQRKIISQSEDVLSLVLIGSCESHDTSYKNLNLKFDFQMVSWDMLQFIMKDVTTTDMESDWFKALIFSVESLKAYEEYNIVHNKKIVIFSDFTHPASNDLNIIIKNIEDLSIEVTIIGPDHIHFLIDCDDLDEPENKRKKLEKSQGRKDGEKVVYDLWKKLPENIVICTFESALKQLCSYTPKSKRVTYWNCIMDIGDVTINISMLKKTDPKPSKKFDTKCIKSEEEPSQSTSAQDMSTKSEAYAPTIRDTVMHYKHISGHDHEFLDVEVKSEDTIEGFRYGITTIPFSGEDKIAMEYKPGPKCFSVLGFTHISNVPYYLLSGDCSYLVLPRNKDKNAEVALSAIIQGMKKLECLAIVKRVYSDNRGLSLGILYPVMEEIFSEETDDVSFREYLLFVELAFQDDIKSIDFPSLDCFAKEITQSQYDAVDDLIDGMNLMKADKGLRGEPCEAFDLPYLHDFKEQFFHFCVIQRGLYPEKPLPTIVPQYIKNYTEVPSGITEKCKNAIKIIKTQFRIKKISEGNTDGSNQSKAGGKSNFSKNNKDFLKNTEHFSDGVIEEEADSMTRTWMRLFQKGFPSDSELEDFFIKLNAEERDSLDIVRSFGRIITQIRTIYSNQRTNPEGFNKWMVGFKKFLYGNSGLFSKLWEVIVTEYVGLISKGENQYSNVTEGEANEFLSSNTNNSFGSQNEKPNFALLDELQAEQMNLDSSIF